MYLKVAIISILIAFAVAMDHNKMNHSSMSHNNMMNHSQMGHSMSGHMTNGSTPNNSSSMNGNMSNNHMSKMDHSMHGDGKANMAGMGHTGHGHMDMSGMDMSGMHDMPGMNMYFHTGYEEYVLFKNCFTTSNGALIAACIIMFVAGIMYEGIKFLREMLLQKSLQSQKPINNNGHKHPATFSVEPSVAVKTSNSSIPRGILSSSHLIQTILHVIQVFVSYCLMLVFMTYNAWLCAAVILGAGVGYFMFGWKRAVVVDSNEHCH